MCGKLTGAVRRKIEKGPKRLAAPSSSEREEPENVPGGVPVQGCASVSVKLGARQTMVDGAASPLRSCPRNSAVPSGAKASEVTLAGSSNLATSRRVTRFQRRTEGPVQQAKVFPSGDTSSALILN